MVEFSPATRETGVWFPANAIFVFYMNAIFPMWLCRENRDVTSIGGSVVEFSPATRETGVWFPANATFVFNMNAIFYIWLCRVNCRSYKHWWFSGRILACHAGDRGSTPSMLLLFLTWMQYFICDCAGKIFVVTSIGGSVVEFSPATRETGVRFPANATIVFNMNAIIYMWLCRANCWRYKHWWFSGRIPACHAGDRGSIPNAMFVFYMNAIFYIWLCRANC